MAMIVCWCLYKIILLLHVYTHLLIQILIFSSGLMFDFVKHFFQFLWTKGDTIIH